MRIRIEVLGRHGSDSEWVCKQIEPSTRSDAMQSNEPERKAFSSLGSWRFGVILGGSYVLRCRVFESVSLWVCEYYTYYFFTWRYLFDLINLTYCVRLYRPTEKMISCWLFYIIFDHTRWLLALLEYWSNGLLLCIGWNIISFYEGQSNMCNLSMRDCNALVLTREVTIRYGWEIRQSKLL